jgi:uncharacterized caspase-like protein
MYKLLPILLFAVGFALTTKDIYDNSYALIIGIDNYENVQPLNYAVDDAFLIADILINSFDFPENNVSLLINEDATRQNILKSLYDINNKAQDNDRILIYFSGHGETMDLPAGGQIGYLIPVDGEIEDLYLSSIDMSELRKISNMTEAKHLLYLVDACYGGLMAMRYQKLDVNSIPNYIEKITQNKSRQIITAGGRGEQTIEKSEWGHSAFTLNLNRGLKYGNADMNADGYITANELGMFLSEKVTIDSEYQQTPQFGRMTSQEGEFVFIKNDKDKADFIYARDKHIMNQASIQIEEILYNESKGKLYDVISGSLDSVMQTSNHNSILSNLNKEQLITLLELSYQQKNNLSANSTEKELLKEKGAFYDNSYAVIIGINEYTKSKPLKYAINDAKAINELLINKFGFKNENIRLLLNAKATYSSIRRELFAVSKLAKPNDRILVYFAGHGQTITTNSNMKIGYLIPVNGNIKEPTLTGIPMDDIFRICQSDSKHMLFLMDACYSGLMAEGTRGIEISKDKKDYISTVANLSARQIITAGSGEEEALEGDEWQHSAFTLNLIKALDNWEADGYDEDGYITASELGEYLKKAVFDETGGRQNPQVERIKRSKGGEFVFSKFK